MLHVFVGMCTWIHAHHDMSVKARRQPVCVGSLLPVCVFQELNLGHQVFQQPVEAAEPSC